MKLYRCDTEIRKSYEYNGQNKIILVILSKNKKKICVLQFFKINFFNKNNNCVKNYELQNAIDKSIVGDEYGINKLTSFTDPEFFEVELFGIKTNFMGVRVLDIERKEIYPCSTYGTELSSTWHGNKIFNDLCSENYKNKNNFLENFLIRRFGIIVTLPYKTNSLDDSIIFINERCFSHRSIIFLNFNIKETNVFLKSGDLKKIILNNFPKINLIEKNNVIYVKSDCKDEYVYLKTDKGYISHNKLKLVNGEGKFKFIPLGLENDEEATIKAGFKMFSNLANIKIKSNNL